jgi:hypothetical protein
MLGGINAGFHVIFGLGAIVAAITRQEWVSQAVGTRYGFALLPLHRSLVCAALAMTSKSQTMLNPLFYNFGFPDASTALARMRFSEAQFRR